MNFTRKKKRGQNQKVARTWLSDEGQYRITWNKEVEGIKVRPVYHACVRAIRHDGSKYWEFAGARRPYKTFKRAVEACERNRKIWDAVLAVDPPRIMKVRELEARSKVGAGPTFTKMLWSLPVWVKKRIHPGLLEMLYPEGKSSVKNEWETEATNTAPASTDTAMSSPAESTSPSVLTETSKPSDASTSATKARSGSTKTRANGRVSRAPVTGGSSTRKTSVTAKAKGKGKSKGKAAQPAKPSGAKAAKGQGSAAGKSAGKSTGKKSASGKKTTTSSGGSNNSGTKPSKSSPKKNGKR